jgi:hypothetical protein
MAGVILTKNGWKQTTSSSQRPSPTDDALKYWLAVLAHTYKHRWAGDAIGGYKVGLEGLSADEIEEACKRTLQTWMFATMPPPGFIRAALRQSLAGTMVERPLGAIDYPDVSQEERDAALASPEYQELKAKIEIVRTQKRPPQASGRDGLVIARRDRVEELERQKKEILSKTPLSADC